MCLVQVHALHRPSVCHLQAVKAECRSRNPNASRSATGPGVGAESFVSRKTSVCRSSEPGVAGEQVESALVPHNVGLSEDLLAYRRHDGAMCRIELTSADRDFSQTSHTSSTPGAFEPQLSRQSSTSAFRHRFGKWMRTTTSVSAPLPRQQAQGEKTTKSSSEGRVLRSSTRVAAFHLFKYLPKCHPVQWRHGPKTSAQGVQREWR